MILTMCHHPQFIWSSSHVWNLHSCTLSGFSGFFSNSSWCILLSTVNLLNNLRTRPGVLFGISEPDQLNNLFIVPFPWGKKFQIWPLFCFLFSLTLISHRQAGQSYLYRTQHGNWCLGKKERELFSCLQWVFRTGGCFCTNLNKRDNAGWDRVRSLCEKRWAGCWKVSNRHQSHGQFLPRWKTIGSNGFTMVSGPENISTNGFSIVLYSGNHWTHGFSMVSNGS